MSVRASTSCPRACSGDMYAGVPTTTPASVFSTACVCLGVGDLRRRGASFASPKSSTFTNPSGRSITFSGLMSRWTMPAACAALSAAATWIAMSSDSRIGQPRRREAIPQRLALDVLHRDVARAVSRLAEREDGADVRVTEGRGGAGLLFEAADARGVPDDVGGQQLERNLAPESHLRREPHLAHAARAERPQNLVGVEPGAGL